jgi:hypothetical protein
MYAMGMRSHAIGGNCFDLNRPLKSYFLSRPSNEKISNFLTFKRFFNIFEPTTKIKSYFTTFHQLLISTIKNYCHAIDSYQLHGISILCHE